MKTYCLNCGHGHKGDTCPKCGISLNTSHLKDPSENPWMYVNAADSIAPAPSRKETEQTSSPGHPPVTPPPFISKIQNRLKEASPADKNALQFIIGLCVALAVIVIPLAMENNNAYEADDWYEDEFYDDFYHNWSETYGFEDFIENYEILETVPEEGIPYETILSPGLYVSGIHFPAGTYTFTAQSGYGYASMPDRFESMTLDNYYDEDSYTELDDLQLPSGHILEITDSLIIHIQTENAAADELIPLENPAADNWEYTVYEDSISRIGESDDAAAPAGIYDIHIAGEPEEYVDIYISTGYSATLYTNTTLKNIPLPEGSDIHVNGSNIVLVPAE